MKRHRIFHDLCVKAKSRPILDVAIERIEELEAEIKRLREALEGAWSDGYCFCGPEGYTDQQKAVQAALTTTESK